MVLLLLLDVVVEEIEEFVFVEIEEFVFVEIEEMAVEIDYLASS